jgi:hypothetical protein
MADEAACFNRLHDSHRLADAGLFSEQSGHSHSSSFLLFSFALEEWDLFAIAEAT